MVEECCPLLRSQKRVLYTIKISQNHFRGQLKLAFLAAFCCCASSMGLARWGGVVYIPLVYAGRNSNSPKGSKVIFDAAVAFFTIR